MTTTIPAGWKLVPIEPTCEMLDAYVSTNSRFHSARSDWAALLNAAPAAPGVSTVEQGIPADVMAALDRMCTPLDTSVLKGATADADAFCMQLIRDYVLRRPAPAAGDALTLALAALENSQPIMKHYTEPNERHQRAIEAVRSAIAAQRQGDA
ncbi:hypothetical protein HGQ98_00505 [Achromobacter ruhlandii]|uniref:Uncharacterized protein n=1 Tax=Achromobacter ruhlandii TaxID=72557 RepID=A0A848NBV3_9BURK|nr:hypothetical protein [Achromobacter ruhlandii]NMU88370.1 hypothetical protein [Achromobacter ruhlandii]